MNNTTISYRIFYISEIFSDHIPNRKFFVSNYKGVEGGCELWNLWYLPRKVGRLKDEEVLKFL